MVAPMNLPAGTKRWILVAKLIFVPLGLVALVYWISQESSGKLADGWNRYLLSGVLVNVISACAIAVRFQRVARVVGIHMTAVEALRINTQSMFYFFFVPFSVGAEVSKFAKVRELDPTREHIDIVVVIVLDRILGSVTLGATALFLLGYLRPIEYNYNAWQLFAIAVGVVALLAVGISIARSRARAILSRVFDTLAERKLDICIALVTSVLMQCAMALAIFVAALGWGIEIGFLMVLFVLSASFLCQIVPLTFVGVSVAEIAGAGLYVAVGLSAADAVILVSLTYFYRLLVAVSGGVWELIPNRRVFQS